MIYCKVNRILPKFLQVIRPKIFTDSIIAGVVLRTVFNNHHASPAPSMVRFSYQRKVPAIHRISFLLNGKSSFAQKMVDLPFIKENIQKLPVGNSHFTIEALKKCGFSIGQKPEVKLCCRNNKINLMGFYIGCQFLAIPAFIASYCRPEAMVIKISRNIFFVGIK